MSTVKKGLLQWPFTDSSTYSVHVGVGIGVQGGKGLCSPPVRSDKEYLMLVYSRPLILLFYCGENRPRFLRWGQKKRQKLWIFFSAAHLLLFDASLQCFYVVLYSHVDESVLGLGLHHPRALRTNHLDGLWNIDVTVHPCSVKTTIHTDASSELVTTFEVNCIQAIQESELSKAQNKPRNTLIRIENWKHIHGI